MSVGDPDDELLCGAGVAGGRRRPCRREQRKRGNGSKVSHFSSHLILLMAGTVTRILCHCNFPCNKGVGAAGSKLGASATFWTRPSARLTAIAALLSLLASLPGGGRQ